uniref:Uncharacterized protein n=1 Tax=Rhizophora mucronata TaxID=61149 RepID=A0A2P2QID3_RHIMU
MLSLLGALITSSPKIVFINVQSPFGSVNLRIFLAFYWLTLFFFSLQIHFPLYAHLFPQDHMQEFSATFP